MTIASAFHWAALLNHALLLASLIFLSLAGACPVWLLVRYLQMRERGQARDRALLDRPLPPADQLPHVLVQLPMFNEPLMARRVIQAAAALEWPRDKLHVQV